MDERLAGLSPQRLLAERRANVLESMRATSDTERELLLFHVGTIDDELERRNPRPRSV